MKKTRHLLAPLGAVCLSLMTMAHFSQAQVLYSEGFDSQASAKVVENNDADTIVTYVDYSNFTVGAATFNVPEAPNMVAGSASTRGVLMQANLVNAAPAIVNLIAADSPGGTPVSFSGDYSLTFDMWLSVFIPVGAGGTEQLVYGIGNDGGVPLGRSNRLDTPGPMGTWGWLATELGYGTEDAVIYENSTELERLGNTQLGQDVLFIDAFGNNPDQAPANTWTQVEVVSLGGNVKVYYNGVLFHDQASASTNGFAVVGYEDPFGSLAEFPDNQWGIADNFVVTQIPEPTGLALAAISALLLCFRRR